MTMKVAHESTTALSDFANSLWIDVMIVCVFIPLILALIVNFYQQYQAYLALGPGGTPSTFIGFLKIKVLGLFAVSDPYQPAALKLPHHRQPGFLEHLAARMGHRPEVRGIAPQRQVTQKAEKAIFNQLAEEIELVASRDGNLTVGTSCIEKHGTGLFTTLPANHTKHKCRAEICHVHPSDGSMHMTLHPADARVVLEAGWGERLPLSRGGRFERFVPAGFMMVYAPRDTADIETVMQIIEAATWFVSGAEYAEEAKKTKGIAYTSTEAAELIEGFVVS